MSPFSYPAPASWQRTRIRFCIDSSKNGAWGAEPGGDEKDVVCIRVADFDWEHLTVTSRNRTVRSISCDQFQKLALRKGDILIEKSGGGEKTPVGRVVRFEEDTEAITSNFVARLRPSRGVHPPYLSYVLVALYLSKYSHQFIKQNTGIQNLDEAALFSTTIFIPDQNTQKTIADFLDYETARLDTLTDKNDQLIALLIERQGAAITQTVTRGLDAGSPMKDSGVGWLGCIPKHWTTLKTKRLFRLVCQPAPPDNDEELLSVYTEVGVRPRKDLEERGNKASTTDGYWMVKRGDLVINKLLAWMGAIGYSAYDGVTSPAYDILRPLKGVEAKFYHYLFRSELAKNELKRRSRGIMDMRLRLYFDELGNIPVPVPPTQEQQLIVDRIEDLALKHTRMTQKASRHKMLIREFRSALITDAVTGQIDVARWRRRGSVDRAIDGLTRDLSL
jgi:type I restriction enzyme S subunit